MTHASTIYDLDDLDDIIAREYLRVSKDESGRARSNAEQHADNADVAERKRWSLGEAYEDVGSASKFKRKRRPDFDQLVADLRSGNFGAHVLIIWEASRGSREVPEWYSLLGLCQTQRVFIFVTSLRRVFNPAIARDWRDLMDLAVDAEYESRRSSERIARSTKADAAAGNFGGGRRPFGYEPDGVTVRESEAAVIRQCVARILAGSSVRSLAAELNERGIRTPGTKANPEGNLWHPGPLGKVLASPRIVGKRVHQGVVVKADAWEPIIDEVTHRRVVATLRSATPVGRRGRTPWLLTGLLTCEHCGESLVSNTDIGGVRRYVCRKGPGYKGCGRLVIKADDTEETLGMMVTDRLADVLARRAARSGVDDDAEGAELAEIAVMRAEALEDRAKGLSGGGIDRATFNSLTAMLDRRQRDVERRMAAKVAAVVPLDLAAVDGIVGRPWHELTTEEQRIAVRAVIVSVRVGPASLRGSTAFEPARVNGRGRITWRS